MAQTNVMSSSFPPRIKYGVNSSGNPDVVPAKAGIYDKETGFLFALETWIPSYQVPRVKHGAS